MDGCQFELITPQRRANPTVPCRRSNTADMQALNCVGKTDPARRDEWNLRKPVAQHAHVVCTAEWRRADLHRRCARLTPPTSVGVRASTSMRMPSSSPTSLTTLRTATLTTYGALPAMPARTSSHVGNCAGADAHDCRSASAKALDRAKHCSRRQSELDGTSPVLQPRTSRDSKLVGAICHQQPDRPPNNDRLQPPRHIPLDSSSRTPEHASQGPGPA